ncbi:sodium-dependent transporter, partial [Planococcus sp. SIMBA_143]
LVEVVVVAWVLRELNTLETHANGISDISLKYWWKACLGVITPLVLGYMMFDLFKTNLLRQFDTPTGNYEGYSNGFILYSGWAVAGFAILVGILFSLKKWDAKVEQQKYKEVS